MKKRLYRVVVTAEISVNAETEETAEEIAVAKLPPIFDNAAAVAEEITEPREFDEGDD